MQYSQPNPGVMRPQQAPLAPQADKLRAAGRDGDTMLAHINPQEAKMLRMAGGRGTPNPVTGLPEFATQSNFDAQMYLQQNPDVAAAGVDPWQHYSQYGQTEGRVGNAEEQKIRNEGYTGGFGGGQYQNYVASQNVTPAPVLDVAPDQGSDNAKYGPGNDTSPTLPIIRPPAYDDGRWREPWMIPPGPSLTDISGVMTPRFDTLDRGQQGILASQGVLQQDIGDVGTAVAGVNTNVGNIGSAIGTPAAGQTVFGDLGNLGSQFTGLMTNFDQFGNDLSSFRGAFDTNKIQTAGTLNDIQEQGLAGRKEINRAIQDQSPAINRTDQAVGTMAANPMFASGSGFMAPMSAPTATNMTNNTNTALNTAAQNQNMAMGPMGPMAVDPRDMV